VSQGPAASTIVSAVYVPASLTTRRSPAETTRSPVLSSAPCSRQAQLRGDGAFGPDEAGARLEHGALVAAQAERREALGQCGAVEHLVRDAVGLRRGDRRREEVIGAVLPPTAGDRDHHAAGDRQQLLAREGFELAPQLV
jgi:hypothetical protein